MSIPQTLHPKLSPSLLGQAVPLILDWYDNAKKPLPWRQKPTPYHVWISEIMLQQTRTAAVIPYYERFLAAIPNIQALADIRDDELMKLWEGLGYYSRARNLKKAAQKIVSDFGGELPKTAKELKTLSGIGAYTAGAISSIAFGEPSAAVDGNVLRVIMRLCACFDDIMLLSTKNHVKDALEKVYPSGKQAGMLTEALMELGENICIPNGEPKCLDCPLSEICLALKTNTRTQLPVRTPKKPRRIETRTVLLLRCGKNYALCKRADSGLLAGLWEFPNIEGKLCDDDILAAARKLGAKPTSYVSLGNATHIFTHIEWHMTGYLVECDSLPSDMIPAPSNKIQTDYAIPRAFHAYTKQILS